jgi:adenosylcobinamide-phosphate synthase
MLLGAMLLDRLLNEPTNRYHPVAWCGRLAASCQRRFYRDSVASGMRALVVAMAIPLAILIVARRLARALGGAKAVFVLDTLVTWTCLCGRSLRATTKAAVDKMESGYQDEARRIVQQMVSRDLSSAEPAAIRRAALETLAENTNDAVVAPALYAVILGAHGAALQRLADTYDSMFGYYDERFARFGRPFAILDDVLAFAPARLTVWLVGLQAASVGGSGARAVAAARHWGPYHPSPNAGRVEAAFAGALGVKAGGPVISGGRWTLRPWLCPDFPDPSDGDLRRALRLSERVERTLGWAALAGAATAVLRRGRLR